MINIEDYLQQIDASFKEKTQKDIYMIYFMLFGLVIGLSYLLFWESAEQGFNESNAKIIKIKEDILVDERYLQANTLVTVANLNKAIKLYKAQYVIEKKNNEYIKEKILAISSLIYDEATWGEYLHSVSTNAKKYNIKINNFNNEYAKTEEGFGHVLDIVLKTTGNYKNTLRFINSLEQSELVIDIHGLNIKAQNKLNTDLNISVWGITYQ